MNNFVAFLAIGLVLVNVAATASVEKISASENGRIIGGITASHRAVVSIQQNDHICAGVIISPKWTLTAASCVVGLSPFIARIRYGSPKTSWGGEIAKIYRIIPHPQFDATRALNDIAVIETEILQSGAYSCLSLTSSYKLTGSSYTVYGWGTTFESDGLMEISQKSVTIPAYWTGYSNSYPAVKGCIKSYSDQNITLNQESLLCVGDMDRGGKGICHGDVGAPLISGSYLYGLASFSYGCGKTGYPGVFTAVGFYYNWINSVTA